MNSFKIHLMFVFITGFLISCVPKSEKAGCASGKTFNATTRSCVVSGTTGNANGVFIASKIPLDSYSVQYNSITATTHSVSITDTFNTGYATRWKIYPPAPATPISLSSNVTTQSITPEDYFASAGTYTIEVTVLDPDTLAVVSSAMWIVTATGLTSPTLALNTTAPNLGSTVTNRLTSDQNVTQQFGVTVTNPDGYTCNVKWYFDGHLKTTDACASSVSEVFFQDNGVFSYDEYPLSNGVHTVKAELTNAGSTVYDTFEWSVFVSSPSLTTLSATSTPVPSTSASVSVLNGRALNAGGFINAGVVMTPGTNDFCLAVANYLGSDAASGVNLQYYINGSTIGSPVSFTANDTYLCLSDSFPAYSLTLANSNIGESKTLTAAVIDVASGSIAATLSWSLSIRPLNTEPVASIVSPSSSTTCNQDATCTYELSVADDDTTDPEDLTLRFYLDGVLLNGTNLLTNTNVVSQDCFYTNESVLDCNVIIPSYDVNGRRKNASYTLTATATDVTTNGAAAMSSDAVTWTIDSVMAQTAPVLQAEIEANPVGNSSYIALLSTPTTPAALSTVYEGDSVVFKLNASDAERDDLRYKIEYCGTNAACTGALTTVVPLSTVTKNDDNQYTTGSYSYEIPEGTITGANSGTVYFKATVIDLPPTTLADGVTASGLVAGTSSTIFDLDVRNFNPFPVWTNGTQLPLSLTTPLYTVTGFPLTFSAGTITDASESDGQVITYQWQYSDDTGTSWNNITGATSSNLIWTPKQSDSGTTFQIRLCLGDDGFDNSVTTYCSSVASPTAPSLPALTRVVGPWTAVVAKNNEVALSTGSMDTEGNDEVAIWKDTDTGDVYTAHIIGVTTTTKIVVNKTSYASNGTVTSSSAIEFSTEEDGTSISARDISIIGQKITLDRPSDGTDDVYKSLYISYVSESVSPPIAPQLRVRRIDITQNRFVFSYSGFIENDTGNSFSITEGASENEKTLTVTGNNISSGVDFIEINGVRLTAYMGTNDTDIAGVNDSECSYNGGTFDIDADDNGSIDSADTIAATIISTFEGCSDDFRIGSINFGAVTAGATQSTNFPVDYLDLSYLITRSGKLMLTSDNNLIIPFVDGLNSNKISLIAVDTADSGNFESGSLGDVNGTNYYRDEHYMPLSTSASLDLKISNVIDPDDVASPFSIYMAIQTSGERIRAYRYDVDTAAYSASLGASNTNVFGSSALISNARITVGPSANDRVFIFGQDSSSVNGEVMLKVFTTAAFTTGAEVSSMTPVSAIHNQTMLISDYQVQALNTKNHVFIAASTSQNITYNGSTGTGILVGKIKPTTANSNTLRLHPRNASNTTDPDETFVPLEIHGNTDVNTKLAISLPYYDFTVGSSGATANENQKDSVFLIYPTQDYGLSTSVVNVEDTTTSATDEDFQFGYIR